MFRHVHVYVSPCICYNEALDGSDVQSKYLVSCVSVSTKCVLSFKTKAKHVMLPPSSMLRLPVVSRSLFPAALGRGGAAAANNGNNVLPQNLVN